MKITKDTRDSLLELSKKKIYLEGNILKVIKAEPNDKEFNEYLNISIEKDSTSRRKRLDVTKQVQNQNKELIKSQEDNQHLMTDLKTALDEAEKSKIEAVRKNLQLAINLLTAEDYIYKNFIQTYEF